MSRRSRWIVVFLAITALAVGGELWGAFDGNPNTPPWTELITHNVPAWIYMPAALLLAVWLPWHLWSNRKRRQQRVTSSLIRTGASRRRKEIRPPNGPHRNNG